MGVERVSSVGYGDTRATRSLSQDDRSFEALGHGVCADLRLMGHHPYTDAVDVLHEWGDRIRSVADE